MKILFVTRSYGTKDGVGRFAHETVSRLAERHEVMVYTSKIEHYAKGVTFHQVHIPTKPFLLWTVCFSFLSSLFVWRHKHQFDIVHSQKTQTFQGGIVTMHSCHRAGIKILNSITQRERGMFIGYIVALLRYVRPLNIVRLGMEYLIVKKSGAHLLAVSNGVREELLGEYGVSTSQVDVVPNGVDLETFSPVSSEVVRSRKIALGFDPEDRILLFAGNGFRGKGLHYIIDALPHIHNHRTVLVVAGNGAREQFVRRAHKLGVEQKICFVGSVSNIEEYVSVADAFVFPSHYESFSLVCFEALASGVPVVIPHIHGISDVLVEGENGYFAERTGEDIARAVNALQKRTSEDKETLQQDARQSVERYSWGNAVTMTEALYATWKHQ